jgi:hypothetical protein
MGPQGEPGPIGPVGATGATGATGPQGPPGISASAASIGPLISKMVGPVIYSGLQLQGQDLLLEQSLQVAGNVNFELKNNSNFFITNLPNIDPRIQGALYKDPKGYLKVSNG